MNSILREIAVYKRSFIAHSKQRTPETTLLQQAPAYMPKDFAGRLAKTIERKENAVIAEVKKASPSRGMIRSDFNPAAIAMAYVNGGATCLSVLTDERYFQGSAEILGIVRQHVNLPVLRKDFMLDPYQVIEARVLGADAILVVLAMVDDTLAAELCATAREQRLSVLPEVHNRKELDRARMLNTQLIGINNRNLHSFNTSLQISIDLLPHVAEGKTVITESGIHGPEDIRRMNEAGIHGFLIGESLMCQSDPGAALASLLAG